MWSEFGMEQESIFLYKTGAGVSNEVVTIHVKFFKSKKGQYQELEFVNFLKPEAGVKTLESGAQ